MSTNETPPNPPPPSVPPHNPRRRARLAGLIGLVATVAIIAGVAVLFGDRQEGKSIVLPDGTKLTIAAVLHDGNREYKPPSVGLPAWIRNNIPLRWVRQMLPWTWMNPGTFHPITNSQRDGITIALETQYTELPSSGARRPYGPFAALSFCLMNREVGFMGKPVKIDISQNRRDISGVSRGFARLEFMNVPKSVRSLEVGLFIVEGSETDPNVVFSSRLDQVSRRVGSMQINNPLYSASYEGNGNQIERLPVSRDLDGITVTLQRLVTGFMQDKQQYSMGDLLTSPSAAIVTNRPNFEAVTGYNSLNMVTGGAALFRVSGPLAKDWQIIRDSIRRVNDPTNNYAPQYLKSISATHQPLISYFSELNTHQNDGVPFEVSVSMRRLRPIDSLPLRSLVVPVPNDGAELLLSDTWVTSGVKFSVTRVTAPAVPKWKRGIELQIQVNKVPRESPINIDIVSIEDSRSSSTMSWVTRTTTVSDHDQLTSSVCTFTISPERLNTFGTVDHSLLDQPLSSAERPTSLTLNFVAYEDKELKFVVMPEDVRVLGPTASPPSQAADGPGILDPTGPV